MCSLSPTKSTKMRHRAGLEKASNAVHLGTIEEASYSLAVRSSQAFLTPVQSTLFRTTCDASMQIDSMPPKSVTASVTYAKPSVTRH